MGVLARPIMFQNAQRKFEAMSSIESLEGRPIEYRTIRLHNPYYGLDKEIKLLFRVTKLPQITKNAYGGLGSERFKFEIDVPVEHESLEGVWSVKEKAEVFLLHYEMAELERFAILITESSGKSISHLIDALRTKNIYLTEYFVKLPPRSQIREFLNELGEVGWIWISDIRDTHLKHVGAIGKRLQNSEVVDDLLQRGRPRAVIIDNPVKNIKIVLSERGTIYSQMRLDPVQMAQQITGLLKLLLRYGLIAPKV